jgi:hypothetical protein
VLTKNTAVERKEIKDGGAGAMMESPRRRTKCSRYTKHDTDRCFKDIQMRFPWIKEETRENECNPLL